MRRICLGDEPGRDDAIAIAAAVLRGGGVAILPAEGVYGLHALATHPVALATLRRLKPRETGKSYIGLVAQPGDVQPWVISVGRAARSLIESHWPGALTLIFEASPATPDSIRGDDGTVALRCPGNLFLRTVIGAVGAMVVSTSANAPGDPPTGRVPEELASRVELVVDAGALSGIPSTIVSVVGDEPRVVRPGAVEVGGPPS